jgi:Protein of unknown function DUF262.
MFESYVEKLNKTESKQFDKLLDMYPSLAPRFYNEVKKNIEEDKKMSQKTKEKMLIFNDHVYEQMFIQLGFLKEVGEFKIGDVVFEDGGNQEKIISEFIKKEDDVFVIFEGYRKAIDSPCMIQRIRHKKRKEGEQSFFLSLKNKMLYDDLTVMDITSSVEEFIKRYGAGDYDFSPEYQRDLVWTEKQKQDFIKALMIGKAEVSPTFIQNVHRRFGKLEVLDGKQRLSTILEFVRGDFSVEGLFYKDFNAADIYVFNNIPMVFTLVKYYDSKKGLTDMPIQQKIELFLQMNGYGQHVSDEHLERVKKYEIN